MLSLGEQTFKKKLVKTLIVVKHGVIVTTGVLSSSVRMNRVWYGLKIMFF
jgi:hypothetical protein